MVQDAFDRYVFEGLMPDVVGHDRRPVAFIVYLHLYRLASQQAHWTVRASHQTIADATGLSRSTVQSALGHLQTRQLIVSSREHPTAVPMHKVMQPWTRFGRSKS